MRKRVPFGRGIVPEVKIDPVLIREPDLSRYYSCERKRKFKTERNAMADLRRIKKTGLLVENAVVYKCEHCGNWHQGHRVKTPPAPPSSGEAV
ncbi:MAG: hypothetical protein K2P95_05045 [Hyphomonadaceae bacterium]|nr:hypothetical protein [Hyphomonadaceae bacterium]